MRCRQSLLLVLSLLFCQPAWAQVAPESAEKYNAGQALFEKRRYQQALQAFEDAVRLDGNNAQAYRGMAKTYQKLKDSDKAIANFRMATTVKADYVEAHYELGNLFINLKRYKDAQGAFQAVLNLDGDFQNGNARNLLKAAYSRQGRDYLLRKNYRKAIEEYENATQLDPTDATNYYNLGLAARNARKIKQAETAFTTAVELNPKYAKAHRQLGDLYRLTKRNSRAIRSYSRAIDSDPNCKDKKNINAYRSLALVYNQTKQHSKAVATLRKGVAVAPTNRDKVRIYTALGYSHALGKHYKSAVSAYQQALALNSRDSEAQYRAAVACFELKQYQNALNYARRAARDRRYGVPAYVIIGDVYDAWRPQGWKEKAIQSYSRGLTDRKFKKYCEDKIDRIKNPVDTGE
ncbi:MAG: tetratricopeptide repeat protein [Gemmatimonadota bacterium]|nr:tetratricopeptide repeat protein [Gemmatimonadota bacterium]